MLITQLTRPVNLFVYVRFCRYAKVKAGEIKVENYHDFVNRKILQARDEEAKKKGKK